MVAGIEQAAMRAHGTEDLLGGLLQMVGGERVGRIDEQASGRVEIEIRSVEELAIDLLARFASSPIGDVTLARDCLGKLAKRAPILVEVTATDRDHRDVLANGAFGDAAAQGKRAVEVARPVGGALLAKALLVAMEGVVAGDGMAAGDALAREAVTAADAVHSDALRAGAMTTLLGAIARQPGRERAVERASLLPPIHQAIGVAHLQLGEYTEALASFEAAHEGGRAVLPRDDPRMPDYIYPPALGLRSPARSHCQPFTISHDTLPVASFTFTLTLAV